MFHYQCSRPHFLYIWVKFDIRFLVAPKGVELSCLFGAGREGVYVRSATGSQSSQTSKSFARSKTHSDTICRRSVVLGLTKRVDVQGVGWLGNQVLATISTCCQRTRSKILRQHLPSCAAGGMTFLHQTYWTGFSSLGLASASGWGVEIETGCGCRWGKVIQIWWLVGLLTLLCCSYWTGCKWLCSWG